MVRVLLLLIAFRRLPRRGMPHRVFQALPCRYERSTDDPGNRQSG
jgi:hypothetical protein